VLEIDDNVVDCERDADDVFMRVSAGEVVKDEG
jgi:hypothetical protein